MCQQGCSRPYWKPRAEGLHPSGHLPFSVHGGTQTVKMQFDTDAQKIQNRCNFHPTQGWKLQRFLVSAFAETFVLENLKFKVLSFTASSSAAGTEEQRRSSLRRHNQAPTKYEGIYLQSFHLGLPVPFQQRERKAERRQSF